MMNDRIDRLEETEGYYHELVELLTSGEDTFYDRMVLLYKQGHLLHCPQCSMMKGMNHKMDCSLKQRIIL